MSTLPGPSKQSATRMFFSLVPAIYLYRFDVSLYHVHLNAERESAKTTRGQPPKVFRKGNFSWHFRLVKFYMFYIQPEFVACSNVFSWNEFTWWCKSGQHFSGHSFCQISLQHSNSWKIHHGTRSDLILYCFIRSSSKSLEIPVICLQRILLGQFFGSTIWICPREKHHLRSPPRVIFKTCDFGDILGGFPSQ